MGEKNDTGREVILQGGFESKPANVTVDVQRGPAYQGVKSAVVNVERDISGNVYSRVVKSVYLVMCAFACRPVYNITAVNHGKDGNLNKSEFSRRGESGAVYTGNQVLP